jgi:hypothetical protein
MIQFDISKSPDQNVLHRFQFFQNMIYIGKHAEHLHINDPALADIHVMIEVVDKDLLIHPQKDIGSYLIDGKRASNVRKIRSGQSICIGSTELKIVSFEFTNFSSKKEILDHKLSQLIESDSPRMQVIEQLANLMK